MKTKSTENRKEKLQSNGHAVKQKIQMHVCREPQDAVETTFNTHTLHTKLTEKQTSTNFKLARVDQ